MSLLKFMCVRHCTPPSAPASSTRNDMTAVALSDHCRLVKELEGKPAAKYKHLIDKHMITGTTKSDVHNNMIYECSESA